MTVDIHVASDTLTPDAPPLSDKLARICADTRTEIARRKGTISRTALESKAAHAPPTRGFGSQLRDFTAKGGFGLIAELKKSSPSGGLIRDDFVPADIARAYVAGGAACISVLTDEPHFQGTPAHLKEARAAVTVPVLRKDFMLDPWQIFESRVMGADCILLIMAALTDVQARELEQLARALDMDVLAEVHDRVELDRALGLQTNLIGINNRNLKTLQTDLNTTIALAPLVPPDRFLIAESGIRDHADLRRLADGGVHCFLVGEGLLRQADLQTATATLLGGMPAA